MMGTVNDTYGTNGANGANGTFNYFYIAMTVSPFTCSSYVNPHTNHGR